MCYLWIRVVCVARMGPGVQRTKKNTPSGTFVLHRISNPENLLGRQKCYPYTNGVFFARSTDGCAAMRAAIGQICSISTVQRENPTCELYFHHRGRPSPRCGLQLTHCVPPHNSKSSKSTGSFKSSMRRPTIAVLATTAAALAPRLSPLRCERRRGPVARHTLPVVSTRLINERRRVARHALPTVSTEAQLQMCWRLVVAAASGSALGFERIGRGRATKRDSPVGVRTMALVSMGSACFTCAGLLIKGGDAARVAAAAATGVGFLGAGVITTSNGIVSGLTTAASIWMAAALGVAAGAGLSLFVAMATGCAMVVLRMPRRAVGRRAARDFERDSIPPKDVEPDP